MANPTTVDIKDKIISDFPGQYTFGLNIFIGREPIDPDEVITLYDTGDSQPSDPKYLLDYPTIQIRSRAKSYETAYSKLADIKEKIIGNEKVTINGTQYVGMYVVNDIHFLQYDFRDRSIFTVNFRFVREIDFGYNREAIG